MGLRGDRRVSFTTRTLKQADAPEPERIVAAAEQLEIARQALIKAARHLDASPTRHQHRIALLAKEPVDQLSVALTDWGSE